MAVIGWGHWNKPDNINCWPMFNPAIRELHILSLLVCLVRVASNCSVICVKGNNYQSWRATI